MEVQSFGAPNNAKHLQKRPTTIMQGQEGRSDRHGRRLITTRKERPGNSDFLAYPSAPSRFSLAPGPEQR
eukprot:3651425-Pyramimonas_sp.AAC.1